MAYQVKSTTSYGQRISGSFKKIAGGFGMFLIGTILLFWNEGNFVKTKKSLKEAEGITVRVNDVSTVDQSLNGKLIHACAFADTKDLLVDGLFGVSETAISISRKVEYYQYEENSSTQTTEKIGGGEEKVTTYTYEKTWTSTPVNSKNFTDPAYKSSNFTLTVIDDKTVRAQNVTFGAYRLPDFIISSISGDIPANVNLTSAQLAEWEKVIHNTSANTKMVHVNGNMVYFGKSPSTPDIGDIRVTLTKILPSDISIIAKVIGSTFEQYYASNGRSVSLVSMGIVSPENMYAQAHSSNSVLTWILRLIGLLLVIGGLKAIFEFLPTLFKVLPFLGKIVGAGIGLVCIIIGSVWSLIIIAIAWLWYRPVIGILLLVIAGAGIWYLRKRNKTLETNN